jgi:hypothetical protein
MHQEQAHARAEGRQGPGDDGQGASTRSEYKKAEIIVQLSADWTSEGIPLKTKSIDLLDSNSDDWTNLGKVQQ